MKQQGNKPKASGIGTKSKANVPQIGGRSSRRTKRKDSEDQCSLPQVIPQNQFGEVLPKQSFQSQTTRIIIQIPLSSILNQHFDCMETTRVQSMPVQIRITREIDNVICFLKLPNEQSISEGQQIGVTLHGKYSWFNSTSVTNKPIKSVRKTIGKQNWEEVNRLKLTTSIGSDFFVVLTLRAEEQLYLDYPGLVNQGNTCYLNSYLQMFFHLPQFRRLIFLAETKQIDKFPATLQMLFYKMLNEERAVSPEELIKSFGWSKKDTQVQQDVQQFSCLFFDILQRKVFVDRSPGRIQSIPELFCGELTNYIECANVPFRNENVERFYDLSIPMAPTLTQALNIFFSETILDEENCYKTQMYGLQQARKGLRLSKMPPVLMLQLKRFQYNYHTDANEKILEECKYPEEIDFGQWTLNPQYSLPYVLYAVLVHQGSSATSGHYYVLLKIENEWFRFNDQRVQRASRQRALQYNYGGQSTTVEYDPKQMKVIVKNLTLKATAYMLVYANRELHPLLFQKGQNEFPQWLIERTKYRQEMQVEKKIRKQSICDLLIMHWSNHFQGQEVSSIGFTPKDRDSIMERIDAIPKNQKVQQWIQEFKKQGEEQSVYIVWSVQDREVMVNANCRSNLTVKQLFNQVQDPSIFLAPFSVNKQEYLVVIKLYNPNSQNPFIYYSLDRIKKDARWKDLQELLTSIFPGQTFNEYYVQDKKTGLSRIELNDVRLIPQTSPARNQLLIVVVQQLKEGQEKGQVEKWYKTELDNLLIIFKNQTNKEETWERQVDKHTAISEIRQIIFAQILKQSTEYQSPRNIVIKYKSKKNSKLLTEAKDNDKLKEIIKVDRFLYFSFSSLNINERLTQKELVFYYRSKSNKNISEPQTIVINRNFQHSLKQILISSSAVRSNLPPKTNHSYRLFLLAKDRAYINDIIDQNGLVPGKGQLLSVLQRQKNTALVIQQYQNLDSKSQPINVLIHHVTKTGQRFGNPLWQYTFENSLLSGLRYSILDLISQQQIEFEGKKHQINPMKVRLLAYVKEWAKSQQLPEPLQIQGEAQVPDDTVGSKYGHPKCLRVGVVHNSISKSVQRLNLNVQ